MHRQAINNSTYESEWEIGDAISDWTYYFNKKHRIRAGMISLKKEGMYQFTSC
jgi:hypothetical protein